MPKEISHWILAEKAAAALRESSIAGRLVRSAPLQYPAHFFYGAVAPDSAFYYLFGRNSDRIRGASSRTHEKDSATRFVQSPYFLELMKQEPEGPFALSIAAFRLGVLSHYAADEAFHPTVEEMAPSMKEHFRLETRLDLYYRSAGPLTFTPLKVGRLLRNAKEYHGTCPLDQLCLGYLSSFAYTPGTIARRTADRVLKMHAAIQRLFFSPLARFIVSFSREYSPLFYARKKVSACPFANVQKLEREMVLRFMHYAEKAA